MPHYNSEILLLNTSSSFALYHQSIDNNQRLQMEYLHRKACQIVADEVHKGCIHPFVSKKYNWFGLKG